MTSKRKLRVYLLLAALLGIGVLIGIYTDQYYRPATEIVDIPNILWPSPKQIGPFSMTAQDSSSFSLADLKGKWTFLFFGYTHCPDVCPLTMTVLKAVYEKLNARNPELPVQVVFVSVDPDRDTPQQLIDYLDYFNKHFIGLWGMPEQLENLTGQIGISYYYSPADENGDYLVNHTSSIFLLGPEARLISIFSAPHAVDTITAEFIKIDNFIREQD